MRLLSETVFLFTDLVQSASYRAIQRVDDFNYKLGQKIVVLDRTKITDEYIEVEYLLKNNKRVYDVLYQLLPKEEFLERKGIKQSGLPYNILIIGIDSLSDAHVQRKLPKLYKYLMHDLSGLIFKGHTIMGDGTTSQLVPMLTGKLLFEQSKAKQGSHFKNAAQLDGWNWLFKTLAKDYGYLTGFSEDGVHPGPFQYRLKGFKNPPTDFYPRPFFMAAAKRARAKYSKSRDFRDLCIQNRNIAQVHLDYVKLLFEQYKNNLKFYFSFNAAYSHNDFNTAEKNTDIILGLVEHLKTKGHLDNTILIVMGDHGVRVGPVRTQLQGILEERLPFYSMIMPQSFRDKYPELMNILKRNTERLTTWLDVHATFHHILTYPTLPATYPRAISLFTDIPNNRTCQQAGIRSHYCPCLEWITISVNHGHVQKAAKTTVRYMNNLLRQSPKSTQMCHNLTLKSVNLAQIERPSANLAAAYSKINGVKKNAGNFCRYRIQFITFPNQGVYEATVKVENKKLLLSSDISRINRYGDQPSCIAEQLPFLRKYCICKNYEEKL